MAVPASPLALDTAVLARQVEAAVEQGLEQTLAEHFAADTLPGEAGGDGEAARPAAG